MYAQNRYQQEEIDRAQEEAEKMYLNKNGEYNGRDDRDRDRDDRSRDDDDDRGRYSSNEYNDRYESERYESDRYGYNGRNQYDERDYNERTNTSASTSAPVPVSVPVPVTTHMPGIFTVPITTKKYRAATYDKHDIQFAEQMQNFVLPVEFNTFTSGLLKETNVSRSCLLEAIADYSKTGCPPLPEAFKKAAEHCRKYRSVDYDIHDQTYAKQMQFYELPPEFSEFTDGLLEETHINKNGLLDAIKDYTAKGLPKLPGVFTDVAFNCRPYQTCVIC